MKVKQIASVALLAALALAAGAGGTRAEKVGASLRDAIIAANAEFMAAFARGDGAGVASHYAEDGQLLQPNGGVISGRRAVQAYWQSVMNSGVKELKLETLEVEGAGDRAAEVGRYTILGGGGETLDAGKYVVLWKREKGSWKLHRDIWNSNRPAPR